MAEQSTCSLKQKLIYFRIVLCSLSPTLEKINQDFNFIQFVSDIIYHCHANASIYSYMLYVLSCSTFNYSIRNYYFLSSVLIYYFLLVNRYLMMKCCLIYFNFSPVPLQLICDSLFI